jgi:hypothetical protein
MGEAGPGACAGSTRVGKGSMDIVLDGRDWLTEADLIEAVVAAVDGPPWHGRNYNALRDSFVAGSVNGLAPPYHFIIQPPSAPTPEVAEAIRHFMTCISDWRMEGGRLSARLTQVS